MAQRRAFTGYGNDQGTQPRQHAYDPAEMMMDDTSPTYESKETFRRRVVPVIGSPEPRPSTLQEILAMLNGGQ